MKYQILDGNNRFHRLIRITPYPLQEFMQEIRNAYYPIIVWDGKNSLKERRKLYPEYKKQRNPINSVVYGTMDIAREVASNMECIQVMLDNFEADDVINYLVNFIGVKNISFIRSNDIDLSGFGIPTLYHKKPPAHLKLYKTLVGKSSDNIKGLYLFGPKSWEALTEEDKCYLEGLLSGKNSYKKCPLEVSLSERIDKNLSELRALWKVSNFLPIKPSTIDSGTKKCTEDLAAIEAIRTGKDYPLWPL